MTVCTENLLKHRGKPVAVYDRTPEPSGGEGDSEHEGRDQHVRLTLLPLTSFVRPALWSDRPAHAKTWTRKWRMPQASSEHAHSNADGSKD